MAKLPPSSLTQSPTVKNVNSFLTTLLALAAGLIVGAGFVLVLTRDKRKKQLEAIEAERTIPEGAVEILDLLTSAGVILNGSNTVVRATNGALALGLVQQADFESSAKKLYEGDFLIMVTDGVLDALPPEEPPGMRVASQGFFTAP